MDIARLASLQALLGGGGPRAVAGGRLKQLLDELMAGVQGSNAAASSAQARAGGCPCCQGACKGGACKCAGGNCARCRKLRGQ